MYKTKLCLSAGKLPGVDMPTALKAIKTAGFECVFFCYKNLSETESDILSALSLGLEIQSLHAPFGGSADMWSTDTDKAKKAVREICDCADLCGKYHIPLMVCHAYIGFEEKIPITELGFSRYDSIVNRAKLNGIRVAFENTEGEEYLDALMQRYQNDTTVGFCWDTGHEMCYNFSADMPGRFPGRLIATHLNDNLGVKDYNGIITWHDDLHLVPFDGIADWDDIARRLAKEHFCDTLTFELNLMSKPNRHENDIYAAMPPERYLCLCYARACKIAKKVQRYMQNSQ